MALEKAGNKAGEEFFFFLALEKHQSCNKVGYYIYIKDNIVQWLLKYEFTLERQKIKMIIFE